MPALTAEEIEKIKNDAKARVAERVKLYEAEINKVKQNAQTQ